MRLAATPQVQTGDRNANQVQSNIITSVNALSQNALQGGNLLSDVSLIYGDNHIRHQLGKKYTGWVNVRPRAYASMYDITFPYLTDYPPEEFISISVFGNTQTVSTTSGSAIVTGLTSTLGWVVGQEIRFDSANTKDSSKIFIIKTVDSPTQITLQKPASTTVGSRSMFGVILSDIYVF